jgi:hypothetical protein
MRSEISCDDMIKEQEVPGRTNHPLSFDTKRAGQEKKKLGWIHRHADSKEMS